MIKLVHAGSKAEPRSRRGGAGKGHEWLQGAKITDRNTAASSPPGRALSLAVSAGVPSPSPVLAAVQPHASVDTSFAPILSTVH